MRPARGTNIAAPSCSAATRPAPPCVRGHFLVRFLPNRPVVDECYAMIDGCLVGRDTALDQALRKAS